MTPGQVPEHRYGLVRKPRERLAKGGLLALTFAISACDAAGPARVGFPADSAAGEIEFRLAGAGGAAMLIPVHINGAGPFDLVMDTGATLTCVDERLASELDLPERRGAMGMGAGVGGSGAVQLVTMDSLRLGGAVARDLTACVLDLRHLAAFTPGARGLLGLNVLKSFRVTIDFQRNVVTLESPDDGT